MAREKRLRELDGSFGKIYSSGRAAFGLLSLGFLLRSRIALKYLSANCDVLDIGAADGAMLKYLSERAVLRSAVSLERNPELVGKIQGYAICGSAVELPFKGGSFDQVICSATRKHIKNSAGMCSEVFRILSPRGSFIVIDPHPLLLRMGRAIGKFDPRYLHHYSYASDIRDELRAAGFEITRSGNGMFTFCVARKPASLR